MNMGELLTTIRKVKNQINPSLSVDRVLITLVDERTDLAKETISILKENYSGFLKIYNSKIDTIIVHFDNDVAVKNATKAI